MRESKPLVVSVGVRGRVHQFVFGAAFVLMGVAVCAAYFVPEIASETRGDPAGLLVMGGAFIAIGAAVAGAFRRAVIDALAGTATVERGVLVALWRRRHPLYGVESVSLCEEVRSSRASAGNARSRSWLVYPVRLEGAERVTLFEPGDVVFARHAAEGVAKHLGLALEDRVGGDVSRREVDELDLSLRERYRRRGIEVATPTQPASSRIEVASSNDTLRLALPAWGFSAGTAGLVLAPAFVALVAYLLLWKLFQLVPSVDDAIPGLIAAIAIGVALTTVGRDVITVDRVAVTVSRNLGGTWTTRIPLAELEEMMLDDRYLSLMSDRRWVTVRTAQLDAEDARFLYESIGARIIN